MKGIAITICSYLLMTTCLANEIKNPNIKGLMFSNIKSDFVLTDRNNYGCEQIDKSVLAHVLKSGVIATEREIHDHYSYTGFTINGTLTVNGKGTKFTFDYGGIFPSRTAKSSAVVKNAV